MLRFSVRKSATAPCGVLRAKREQHHELDQLAMTRTIHLRLKLARIVPADELIATHVHQPASLSVEILMQLLVVEAADPTRVPLWSDRHALLLDVRSASTDSFIIGSLSVFGSETSLRGWGSI